MSNYQARRPQLDYSDRLQIEAGLNNGSCIAAIARELSRNRKSISQEIQRNRTFVKGNYPLDNNCHYARVCSRGHLCEECNAKYACKFCSEKSCNEICRHYIPRECYRTKMAPFVCNSCSERSKCDRNRYIYIARAADTAAAERRSFSRQGPHLKGEEFQLFDAFISERIKKGQPLSHIYAEYGDQLPVTKRTAYNYIDSGEMSVSNLDLQRKVRYRKRKKKAVPKEASASACRNNRTYEDFMRFVSTHPHLRVVQMDTVKGTRDKGPVILTMLFVDTNVMLMFLIPDCKAQSVIDVFDGLTNILGIDIFRNLFSVILTDNGSEFKNANRLEMTVDGKKRCNIFYCDPQASWQKGELEKNHEFIRYILPKGKTFRLLSKSNMVSMMNNINSVKRIGLGGHCPYELIPKTDGSMHMLMKTLKMNIIPPDDVQLSPIILK